jgi:hypothetical protein
MDPDGYLWEVAFNPDTPDGVFALGDQKTPGISL